MQAVRWPLFTFGCSPADFSAWGLIASAKTMNKKSIETHPDRPKIEYDIARGVPPLAVAKKYGLKKDAVYRLKKRLPPQLKAAMLGNLLRPGADLDRLRTEESEGLLANLATQRARLLLAQDAAMAAENLQQIGQLAGHIHRNVELVGKYLGEFAQHQVKTTISVLVQPEYLQLRAALLRALQAFPDARKSVAMALHQIEDDASRRMSLPMIEHRPLSVEIRANEPE